MKELYLVGVVGYVLAQDEELTDQQIFLRSSVEA
uniref:Uncharacterized protein n=1 Tax=Rhizophora mucronata TaxID=61149 RepID=A0A2P2KBX6_RHIMU